MTSNWVNSARWTDFLSTNVVDKFVEVHQQLRVEDEKLQGKKCIMLDIIRAKSKQILSFAFSLFCSNLKERNCGNESIDSKSDAITSFASVEFFHIQCQSKSSSERQILHSMPRTKSTQMQQRSRTTMNAFGVFRRKCVQRKHNHSFDHHQWEIVNNRKCG